MGVGKGNRILQLSTGALALGVVTFGTLSFVSQGPEPKLPVPDPAVQTAYENDVADFLQSNSEPRSGDFDHTVEGRNAYWQAMAKWWESIPWEAVAGQWGCLSQGDSVTFNPPDERGVITAGHGGSGTCGGVDVGGYHAIFSVPETRSAINSDAP